MIDVDWRVQEIDGVTLVAAVVDNEAPTPRRITVEPCTDEAVLPPRTRGLPERGWSDEEFTGVVPADGRLAVGFACRDVLDEPPVVVDDRGRASGDSESVAGAGDPPPTDVLRSLGSPVPPRDAVPNGAEGMASSSADQFESPRTKSPRLPDDRRVEVPSDLPTAPEPSDDRSPNYPGTRGVPSSVTNWLDDVAIRADQAERLAQNRSLDGAAMAVEAVGGVAGVEQLVDDLEADETALRTVADRVTALADACERREDVPMDAYRELA